MREFDKQMNRAFKQLALKPRDIFESCYFHPVLCLGVDYKHDEIWGISLIDGKHPMSCSLVHCGVRKLTPKQAWAIKTHGPAELEAQERIPKKKQWWRSGSQDNFHKVGLIGPAMCSNHPSRQAHRARR